MAVDTLAEYCARLIEQQRRETRQVIEAGIDYAIEQKPQKSGRASVLRWMEQHPHGELFREYVFDPKMDHGARLLESLDQHALALQSMMNLTPLLTVPLMTVYRAMLEGAAQLCHLFDGNEPAEKIAARAIAAQIDTLQGTEKMGHHFSEMRKDGYNPEEVREALQAVLKHLTDEAQIEFETAGRGQFKHHAVTVKVGPYKQNVKPNASDQIFKYIGESWLYELGSGAAHSRPWALPSFVDGFDDPPQRDREGDIVIVATEGVFLCADGIAKAVEAETGYDTKPARKRTLLRRNGLLESGRNLTPSLLGLEDFESRPRNFQGQRFPADYAKAFLKRH